MQSLRRGIVSAQLFAPVGKLKGAARRVAHFPMDGATPASCVARAGRRALTCAALLVFALAGPQPVSAQLKGILKSAQREAERALGQQGQPTAQGTQQGQQRVPPGSTAAQVEIDKPQLWPDLAVDDATVARQQAALRVDCEAKHSSGGLISCDCVVAAYPQARLMDLSREIRRIKHVMDTGCARDRESAGCQTALAHWNDVTGREYQRRYPEEALSGTRDHGRLVTDTGLLFPPNIYTHLVTGCVDSNRQREDTERNCVQSVESGSLRLPPGRSTKAYCSCVGDEVARAFQSGQVQPTSKDMVGVQSQARVKCKSN